MDFDWAAWHKKFEDFGLSTKTEVNGDAKFPGSFPEYEATGGGTGGEVKSSKADAAASSSHGTGDRHLPESNRQQHTSNQGWKQEMEEEAADPVWKEHLDKLQATGKLGERSDRYSSTDAELSSGGQQEKEEDIEAFKFSFNELQEMLTEAESLRKDGNELYKSGKDMDYEAALETYQRALNVLPETSISRARVEAREKSSKDAASAEDVGGVSVSQQQVEIPSMMESGLVELTDEQAAALEQEEQRKSTDDSSRSDNQKNYIGLDDQVEEMEGKIEEIKGFLYGNISAVQVALHKDTEAVEAASKSLLIDPHNAKVRLRRAKVNEKIGKFTSLSESLEDYKYLLVTLPHNDSRLPQIRRAVAVIPGRIEQAGKAEMEQMVTQMKEWGDSILGWFGMKCDDFKTETQPDGSTSININKSG